jgi:hypothetical protein
VGGGGGVPPPVGAWDVEEAVAGRCCLGHGLLPCAGARLTNLFFFSRRDRVVRTYVLQVVSGSTCPFYRVQRQVRTRGAGVDDDDEYRLILLQPTGPDPYTGTPASPARTAEDQPIDHARA